MNRATRFWILVLSGAVFVTPLRANPPDEWMQYRSPEAAGFDSESLAEARELAQESGAGAVFVVYRGAVVAAWGEIDRRFRCHSVRKSLLSALIGTCVAEGRLDLQETLADLRIDDRAALSGREKQARAVDLIRSRSGVYHPAAKETKGMRANRPSRESHPPGEHFWYNNWDFNVLGVILERKSGQGIYEAFQERIARPIGMEDFRPVDFAYQMEPSSSLHPAYSFRMSARDLARFGRLFAQGGTWDGRPIVPESWVETSTSLHSDTGDGYGYGYMWWVFPRGTPKGLPEMGKYDKFAASGTGSQFLMVIPEIDFVFVVRGDTDNREGGPSVPQFKLVEMILAARTADVVEDASLRQVEAVPFENRQPAPNERRAIEMDPQALREYIGLYEAPEGLTVKVHLWNGRLFALAHGEGETELLAEAPDRFFTRGVSLQMRFLRDASGAVRGAEVRLFNRPMRLTRAESSE